MSAHRTAVLNIVGLSASLLRHAPRIRAAGRRVRLEPVLPAVTCPVQSSMLTGLRPCEHGIVANGWYERDAAEVCFWRQSNRLVSGEKVWETARRRDAAVTTANLFWWFNMYSTADVSVTPRPMYPADGRKIPDVYTEPAALRDELQAELGRFPLFKFWGPRASIESSEWIAEAALRVNERYRPTLQLVYLPHLDYPLQKLGPDHPEIPAEVARIDAVVGRLLDRFDEEGIRTIVLSEYAIEPVTGTVFVNRALREAGLLRVREELGRELLDAGASAAFAVADHQVAHVYVNEPAHLAAVRELCTGLDGIESILGGPERSAAGLDHPRSGNLVLVAAPGRWITYDYWLDEVRAPDFARTVDIHRKPGFDPRELFIDPDLPAAKLKIAWRLAQKKLGLRALMDVIPLDTSLVRGSHGRSATASGDGPVLVSRHLPDDVPEAIPCTGVRDVILDHLFNVR
jgi:predicted AlkP superfamily pyrophosphatase or phosphodiesterase